MENKTYFHKIENGEIAYEVTGEGPVLVFLPGWPFNRHTYRKIIPKLALNFTCVNIDTIGLGESTWDVDTDFSISSQVRYVKSLLNKLEVTNYNLISFDSGGAIVRALAASEGRSVNHLILLNTDIPGERPPWLALYKLIFQSQLGRRLMNNRFAETFVIPSNLMLGLCFDDLSAIDDEFKQLFVKPMHTNPVYFEGLGRYLRGFSYREVDHFNDPKGVHQQIAAPVSMIWGENDQTFPLPSGLAMSKNIPSFKEFHVIPRSKLLPHEERPGSVVEKMYKCLQID